MHPVWLTQRSAVESGTLQLQEHILAVARAAGGAGGGAGGSGGCA